LDLFLHLRTTNSHLTVPLPQALVDPTIRVVSRLCACVALLHTLHTGAERLPTVSRLRAFFKFAGFGSYRRLEFTAGISFPVACNAFSIEATGLAFTLFAGPRRRLLNGAT